jgi:Uma2 family endonuclease
MATTTKLYTGEDLLRMPTDEPWEIWEGELRKVPGSGLEASEIAGDIFTLIRPFVRANKLGVLATADGTFYLAHSPDTIVVPDVAFIRWDRLPGGVRPQSYSPAPPDLAIEVVSPSDRPSDVAKKMNLHRSAGVPLVWWVYPDRRTVRVFQDGVLGAELGEGDVLDGGDVLPGFRLPVAEIFAEA